MLIYLDPDSAFNLQNQIRQKLVEGILSGALAPGQKLPSSRKLAQQLDVARNTVVYAYQELIAEGYLLSRSRSGIFVSDVIPKMRVEDSSPRVIVDAEEAALWARRTRRPATLGPGFVQDLPNWSRYPYPFIDGKFDRSLFPVAEWREANRLALSINDVGAWSTGSGDADDAMLLDEIRTKMLTRRGIHARSDEILLTLGTQNSLYLISHLLADQGVTAAVEEPGNSDFRSLLAQNGAKVLHQPVDAEGMVVNSCLDACDLVYVTPSHQIPTAVCMSPERRTALLNAAQEYDFLVIEDDYECEINYLDKPQPALRSMDETGRVIYVGSLSNVLAPGLRLGFIVADAPLIQRARVLRRTVMNHPPLNNQRTTAYFLALGHYDSLMMRLSRIFQERRLALRDALNWMRGVPMEISPEVGGTTYWVRTPEDFDVEAFAGAASRQGILIESVRHYYGDSENAENCFRMGITSLQIEQIRPGVTRLVELIRSQVKTQVEHLSTTTGEWLKGEKLVEAISGATILYREVDGAPCTIKYHRDGTMTGVLGFSNEEQDTGQWRIEDDRLFRQWSHWNYAEGKVYSIVIDNQQIRFFNADGQVVDSAFFQAADDEASGSSSDLPAWSITAPVSGPT
ncbi:transcriptional regulator, GntR family [Luminiphilus syltensis NOR5-1B]|uniref:Transcriptional regulator, GntR family n=1 Tax=Luminiphilus syltensis NOR5-1B TaxID=565045 RepID=B8KTF5_9GAMM|nr:PLP-dependent aminotransferase family protein [Luminiphilus syltensis]EED35474.1 transcriptional regulator, GntR family [Luminiphilus syltensis NOR5-1B]